MWMEDESRWGLRSELRRRLTARGVKVRQAMRTKSKSEWWVTFVEGKKGRMYHMRWSKVDGATMEKTLEEFAAAYKDEEHVVVWDGSGAHRKKGMRIPANVHVVYLPAYSPELNPAERIWEELRQKLPPSFSSLDALFEAIWFYLSSLSSEAIRSLTFFPYLRRILQEQ